MSEYLNRYYSIWPEEYRKHMLCEWPAPKERPVSKPDKILIVARDAANPPDAKAMVRLRHEVESFLASGDLARVIAMPIDIYQRIDGVWSYVGPKDPAAVEKIPSPYAQPPAAVNPRPLQLPSVNFQAIGEAGRAVLRQAVADFKRSQDAMNLFELEQIEAYERAIDEADGAVSVCAERLGNTIYGTVKTETMTHDFAYHKDFVAPEPQPATTTIDLADGPREEVYLRENNMLIGMPVSVHPGESTIVVPLYNMVGEPRTFRDTGERTSKGVRIFEANEEWNRIALISPAETKDMPVGASTTTMKVSWNASEPVVESAKHDRKKIAAAFGIPPEALSTEWIEDAVMIGNAMDKAIAAAFEGANDNTGASSAVAEPPDEKAEMEAFFFPDRSR